MKTKPSQAKEAFRLNINKSGELVNCLVTGYDPFENQSFNPSQAIVNTSPESFILSGEKVKVSLNRLVLPVCGERAWPILEPVLDEMAASKKPCVIVMFGLAAMRQTVNLERFALNIMDGDRKDNCGHVYNGQIIELNGPQAARTKAPIEEAMAYLKQKGLPAEISNFCGTYVCNEVYFKLLRYFEKSRVKSSISFVHLPLPKVYGKALEQKGTKKTVHLAHGKKNQLEAMQLVLNNLVDFYCRAIL